MANKMAWVKLASGFLRDEKIHFIIKKYGHDTVVFWAGLLTECKRGTLEMNEEVFAEICIMDPQRFEEIKKIFIKFELVTQCNGEKLKVTNWEKYQYSDSYERVKRHREQAGNQDKQEIKGDVTECNDQETENKQKVTVDTDTDTDTDTEKDKEIKNIYPAWLDLDAWRDFQQHRKSLKAKMSPLAERKAISLLDELRKTESQRAIIDRSIMNGWRGLFPRSEKSKPPNAIKPPKEFPRD